MQRKKMFLVVCVSALLTGSVKAQNFLAGKGKCIPKNLEWRRESFHFSALPARDLSGQGNDERMSWPAAGSHVLPAKGMEVASWQAMGAGVSAPGDRVVIPANRVVTHFGFFCRQELELEKTIRLPLRFRLGSLEYCNRLEGK